MKNADQLAKQLSQQLSTESQTQTGSARKPRQQTEEQRLDKLKINNVFEALNIVYPFWLKGVMNVKKRSEDDGNYDSAQVSLNAARRLWQMKLHHVSIKMAVEATDKITGVLTIDQKSGPTPAQFLSCCRTNPAHQDFDMSKALPAPNRVNQSVGESALDEIKRKLNMK